jgi:isopenicillin N synthase-like dioxygenase
MLPTWPKKGHITGHFKSYKTNNKRGTDKMSSLPIISLAAFDEADSAAQEAEKLRDACLEHGFFYLKDHGVSEQVVNATLEASRSFFNLPNEVKRQYDHDVQKVYPKTSRGYIPMYGGNLARR